MFCSCIVCQAVGICAVCGGRAGCQPAGSIVSCGLDNSPVQSRVSEGQSEVGRFKHQHPVRIPLSSTQPPHADGRHGRAWFPELTAGINMQGIPSSNCWRLKVYPPAATPVVVPRRQHRLRRRLGHPNKTKQSCCAGVRSCCHGFVNNYETML